MIRTPSEALEVQHQIAEWWRTQQGMSFIRVWAEKGKNNQRFVEMSAAAIKAEPTRLAYGKTFWIAAEMVELARHAALTMPDQELQLFDLPVPCGVAVFEQPICQHDIYDKQVNIGMLSWGPCVNATASHEINGVMVLAYSDRDGIDDYIEFEPGMRSSLPKMLFLHSDYFPINARVLGDVDEMTITNHSGTVTIDPREDAIAKQALVLQRKLPITLWTLMQQTLVEMREERPTRPTRRRLEKAGREVPTIRVVTLRRISHPHPSHVPEHVAREWTHRWIVSGHWRNQYLPSMKRHRLQWIAPYQKGPDDKPLVVKQTVRQLVR